MKVDAATMMDITEGDPMPKSILFPTPVIPIHSIILDLDDTLNTFTMHLLGQLGCNVLPYDYDSYPVDCGYGIIAAWSELTNRPKPSIPDFWEMVTRDMWACAPKSHQFWLLEHCADLVGRDNVGVATVPTKSADCVAGKHDWIERHLPLWCQRQYDITPRKHKLAHQGVLLIDDSDANCERFVVDKSGAPNGASAIVCPRPWNHLHQEDCNTYVRYMLSNYTYH